MSGGPPHHPHNRPLPAASTAWNHLQVPNFFPRQPQHAHMSSEHPLLHQPTWHTPTTDSPLKSQIPHSHLINLEQMLSERPYLRQSPGVDLTLARAASGLNGDLPMAPISLSVRDTNKINSLAASALERQNELKPLSPLVKVVSPLKSASPPATVTTSRPISPLAEKHPPHQHQQLSPMMRKVKRVDSILERLNPQIADSESERGGMQVVPPPNVTTTAHTNSSHDENSNSSSILNVPTPREEDVVSPYSNEDSLDSNKSRRKRKPAKTMKVTKEVEQPTVVPEPALISPGAIEIANANMTLNAGQTANLNMDAAAANNNDATKLKITPKKLRRKTSSEDETIDKIAAMVGNIVTEKMKTDVNAKSTSDSTSGVGSSVIVPLVTVAQKKDFVAVEDKLEEMFAGLEDSKDINSTPIPIGCSATSTVPVMDAMPSTSSQDKVSSTSNELMSGKKTANRKRKLNTKGVDGSKKKKKAAKAPKAEGKKRSMSSKKVNGKAKSDSFKDVYAYDSGSNASSSKSRGPFVHISGPRESPISVSVVNAPSASIDDDGDLRKPVKPKKYFDDGDYRIKTRDASWICAFCKRGPYSSEFNNSVSNYTLGDLFGPYHISNNCEEFSRRMDDPFDAAFKSRKAARAFDLAAAMPGTSKQGSPRKSAKRKSSDTQTHGYGELGSACTLVPPMLDCNRGIMQLNDTTYEVWVHEDCIVWAPGIYLLGSKVVGLDEAVWAASNVECARCHHKGANICCLKRGCSSIMHLGCAIMARWDLDYDLYRAHCVEHKTPMLT